MPHLRKRSASHFLLSAEDLAERLIGSILVRQLPARKLRARIVETEAYLGPIDLASHASKGRTPRTEVMFGPAGRAYVYLIYGMYHMLNVVAGPPGSAHAVLIRAAEPLDGWHADLSGPGKLARALKITRAHNGLDLRGAEISLWYDPAHHPRIIRDKRVGIDYAKHWAHAPLRFFDADSNAVSQRSRQR